MRDLVASGPWYGYRRLLVLLQREEVRLSHKLMYRLSCEESLGAHGKRTRRRQAVQVRLERQVATAVNEVWRMDFMSEQLFKAKAFHS